MARREWGQTMAFSDGVVGRVRRPGSPESAGWHSWSLKLVGKVHWVIGAVQEG
jgi:hypothetical protein